jgi:hypothetical protein
MPSAAPKSENMFTVNYETENPIPQYTKELDLCETLQDYKALVEKYSPASYDLRGKEPTTEEEIKEFKEGREKVRTMNLGEAWCKRWGSLLLPCYFMHADIHSRHFKCPWGVAYMQIASSGLFRGVDPDKAKQEIFAPVES